MTTLRRVLQDRVSASALGLLVGLLLLIQGVLSGTAQGAMAASAVDSLHVICSVSGTGSVDPNGHGNLPAKKLPECPCGTLCRLASTAMPAILGGQSDLLPVVVGTATEIVAAGTTLSPPTLRGLIAEPRAPPVSA